MRPARTRFNMPFMTLAGLAIALSIVFWVQIKTGFSLVMGDPYDGVIENTLVNHWFWVLRLERKWNEVGYFYPHLDTLGYNDSYFLFGIIAAGFRSLGLNPFVAGESAHILIKAAGFLGFIQLSNKLGNTPWASIFGALLFSIALNSTNHGHAQLLLVGLCPLFWLLSLIVIQGLQKKCVLGRFAIWAFLLGAMLLTGFYITYFMCLFLGSFIFLELLMDPSQIRPILRVTKTRIIPFTLTLIAAVTPFLFVYLPKLNETGGHNPSAVFGYLLSAHEIVNGSQSLLWGDSIHEFFSQRGMPLRGGEHNVGFPPFFLLCFAISALAALKRGHRGQECNHRLFFALTITTLFWLVACIDWNGRSLWLLIYQAVPGAKGLRVVARFYIFLALPMTLIIGHGISIALNLKSHVNVSRAIVTLCCLVLIAEEINPTPYVALPTEEPLRLLKQLTAPPTLCRNFYVVNAVGFKSGDKTLDDPYRTNVQAMMISSFLNLPTVVGISSFNPPGWNFSDSPAESFDQRVLSYAFQHQTLQGLCRLDVTHNKWSLVSFEEDKPITDKVFDLAHPSNMFLMAGFHGSESWGTWSSVNEPRILFKQVLPNPVTITLFGLKGFGSMANEPLEISCGSESHYVTLNAEPQQATLTFRGNECSHTLRFKGSKTTKPKDLPNLKSLDNRNLGFGLSRIEISKAIKP